MDKNSLFFKHHTTFLSPEPDASAPPLPTRNFEIQSSCIRLGSASGLFPSAFRSKTLYAIKFSAPHNTNFCLSLLRKPPFSALHVVPKTSLIYVRVYGDGLLAILLATKVLNRSFLTVRNYFSKYLVLAITVRK